MTDTWVSFFLSFFLSLYFFVFLQLELISFFLVSAVKMQQTDEMQAIVLVALVYGGRQYDTLQADNITSTGCSCCCGCC